MEASTSTIQKIKRKLGERNALLLLGVGSVALFGLYGIGNALEWWIAIVLGAVTLALACIPWKPSDVVSAALLALLTLIGINVLAHLVGMPKLPIVAGLAIAFLVIVATAYCLLWLKNWGPPWAAVTGVAIAVVAILVPPIVVAGTKTKSTPVPKNAAGGVPSRLDLLIVTDGSAHRPLEEVPPDPELEEFEVHYSVGYAEGDGVRWTLLDSESPAEALKAAAQGANRATTGGPPPRHEHADTALALFVDGSDPVTDDAAQLPNLPARPGEVARWRLIGDHAAPAGTPTFALLQSSARSRLHSWKGFEASGEAISVQTLGSRTATDAVFRLAVGAPSARTDLALATVFQPIILFDREEPVPRMLSISALFAAGRVQLCDDKPIGGTDCTTIRLPRELRNGGTHLRLTTRPPRQVQALAEGELSRGAEALPPPPAGTPGAAPERTPPPGTLPSMPRSPKPPGIGITGADQAPSAPLGAGNAIYVNPVAVNRDHKHLLYLDYWWYLTDNPVGVGGGALCGFGLVIAGITCLDHQSDWEGMTVVVDRTGAEPHPIAVQYAQHADVIRYGWNELRNYWDHDKRSLELIKPIPSSASRPLAYVAKGTHATYPFHCGECDEVAHSELSEGSHRGGTNWIGNLTGSCGDSGCLQLLPTREGGREPALWSAYEGPWGERHCEFEVYCDSDSAPAAPGQQGRYEEPTEYDGTGDEQGGWLPSMAKVVAGRSG